MATGTMLTGSQVTRGIGQGCFYRHGAALGNSSQVSPLLHHPALSLLAKPFVRLCRLGA